MASLSRKFLAGIGIEDDKADLIIEKHQEVLNEVKTERDKYKEDAETLPDVQKELEELKQATNDGKENAYKVKYDALKEEFDNYKTEVETKAVHQQKESAFRELLKEVGISEKRIDAVLRVSEVDKVEFDKEGKIKDADAVKKSIKDEWSDFIVTQETKGAESANPPQNSGNTALTKADIMKIKDTAERQNAWKEYLNQQANVEQQKG